jgi:hypothetical protein
MSSLLQQIKSLDINKQNTLTPGNNISIVDNVISSSDEVTQAQLDTKQDTLTAGTNLTIDANNVISSTASGGGEVTQADLDLKQDILTAGDNITITGDVISSSGGITQAQLDTKQDTLTAGDNITITGDVISSSGGITQAQLDTKQDVITSTTNISSNTLNTVAGVSVGGALSIGGIDLDTKIATATSGKQDTIQTTTDISLNTLTTAGDVNVGGNLTTPNRISFYATTDKSLFAVNQGLVPPFNIIVQNIGNAYDNTTYQFTAPVAGTYYFGFSFYSNQNIGFVATLELNGSTIAKVQRNPGYTSSYTKYQISATAFCLVGDVVRPRTISNSIVIQVSNDTHFFGFLIG